MNNSITILAFIVLLFSSCKKNEPLNNDSSNNNNNNGGSTFDATAFLDSVGTIWSNHAYNTGSATGLWCKNTIPTTDTPYDCYRFFSDSTLWILKAGWVSPEVTTYKIIAIPGRELVLDHNTHGIDTLGLVSLNSDTLRLYDHDRDTTFVYLSN